MKESTFHILRSPQNQEIFNLKVNVVKGDSTWEGELTSSSEQYIIGEGLADLTYPKTLLPSDREFKEKYDSNASEYQAGMDWLFNVFYEEEKNVRQQMAEIISAQTSDLILDIGCGTGKDAQFIFQSCPETHIILADISCYMLKEARKNLEPYIDRTDFILCNGSYLPFADNSFDKVFHFGGINEFGDKARAIREFNRVVKPGGKIIFGDEGVAPWLANKEYGQILKKANPLYTHTPPVELLPSGAKQVKLHWLLGNAFYLIEFENSKKAPSLNLDLPIPGKRGGTLRSRYEEKQG